MTAAATETAKTLTRQQLLIFMGSIAIVITLIFGSIFISYDAIALATICYATTAVAMVILYLAWRKVERLAAVLWIASGVIGITAAMFFIHPSAHMNLVLIVIGTGSFILLGGEKNRFYLVVCMAVLTVGFLIATLVGPHFDGAHEIDASEAREIAHYIDLMIFLAVTGQIFAFSDRMFLLTEKLNQTAGALTIANAAKSRFLATMSHELRTPMNGVLGTIELLESSELSVEQKELTGVAKKSSRALLDVLSDMLDMASLDAGDLETERAAYSPIILARTVNDLMATSAEQAGITLTLEIAPDVPPVIYGDRARLLQVLLKLASNAVKFSPRRKQGPRPKVRIFLNRSSTDTVAFSFSDEGEGISESVRDKVFQPFTQADETSTRRHEGTGLGLAIAKRLTETMGGKLELESSPDQGTTVTVHLPIRGEMKRSDKRTES